MMVLQMMNIWTFFENDKQFEDMDSPWKGGTCQRNEASLEKWEKIDNMDPPMKGGVLMRLTLMMG